MPLMTDEERAAYEAKCRAMTAIDAFHEQCKVAEKFGTLADVRDTLRARRGIGPLGLTVMNEYEVEHVLNLIDAATKPAG